MGYYRILLIYQESNIASYIFKSLLSIGFMKSSLVTIHHEKKGQNVTITSYHNGTLRSTVCEYSRLSTILGDKSGKNEVSYVNIP